MSGPTRRRGLGRMLAIAACVVAALAVMAAVLVDGTPSQRRAVRMDERRVQDLVRLERAIDAYHEREGRYPANLAVLAAKPGSRLDLADPESGKAYAFRPSQGRNYQLCAEFNTDTGDARVRRGSAQGSEKWEHGRGWQCFNLSLPKSDD